jgi:hypothetical protein
MQTNQSKREVLKEDLELIIKLSRCFTESMNTAIFFNDPNSPSQETIHKLFFSNCLPISLL